MTGAQRRYAALRARAADQGGTPEGVLCTTMADRMLAADPDLADVDREVEETLVEYRYKTDHERLLLMRIGVFMGVGPRVKAGSRAKQIIYITDAATHAAIDHAFAVLAPRMARLLHVTWVGFVSGSLPLPATGSENAIDPGDLADAAASAADYGRASQPRKALGSGSVRGDA